MGLGRETSSSSVSLSMLKVPKEGTTSVNSNYKSSHVASNFMVICLRPSPFFLFRLASNALPDIGLVSRIEKKKIKKITSLGIGGPGTPGRR